MKDSLSKSLYEREISELPLRTKSHRKLYGDRRLVENLDIVNELDGHSGCVNALSWSKSGELLASGSDDQHLNIHQYQPHDADSQFKLATSVATGHMANIFSVKFMPHSNDRTVITAAGDHEVRVFDLEYAGQAREASRASAMASEGRRGRRHNVYDGVRYLSDGDTDARVYRSHGDRVKRIVTESSPHLFLTCSEDGEVRQWDLRQPSSAYPPPRGGRFSNTTDNSLPPPLISYKRYQLDLNSISCSASQPHYIALGGAHLHAFLHDRRMAGRDRMQEAGKPLGSPNGRSGDEEELMGQATQCVRKFAPKGQKKMSRRDNGHITALKIGDARPNEMIASWSGDHIYSFDLVNSQEAGGEGDAIAEKNGEGKRVKEGKDRKRKRQASASQTSLSQGAGRPKSRPRTGQSNEAALRVRYQNGQSEDIPLSASSRHRNRPLTEQERNAQRIAKASSNVRSSLFGTTSSQQREARYTNTLSHCAAIFTDLDEEMRDWRYPVDPSAEMVVVQQTLRQNRESTRRFVQAAGTIARVMGGRLQTPSANQPLLAAFSAIETRGSDRPLNQREQFGYDFLKATLLWLDSGLGALVEGFTRPAEMLPDVKAAKRLPIPAEEAGVEAIDEFLIPYLLRMASEQPVTDLDANRFEVDENTQLFATEKAAVLAFAAAVKIPFADLSSAVVLAEQEHSEGEERVQAQDRGAAVRFWGEKVARGVLLNAAEGVNFVFVSRAFGGPGRVVREVAQEEEAMERVSEGDEEEVEVGSVEVGGEEVGVGEIAEGIREAREREREREGGGVGEEEEEEEEEMILEEEDDDSDDSDNDDENDDNDDEDVDMDSPTDDDSDTSSLSEEDGVPNVGIPRFLRATASTRSKLRYSVNAGIPCHSAVRSYRGHCNVKTVKDVNYFGLDDEYVVSGSDDGNFFVWDAKTGELVNVLEGDGEVVNVVQGHPYETMMAVSGIDHTIKIFSPDARARDSARLGRGITAHDSSEFSSLAWPARLGRRRASRRSETTTANGEQNGAVTSEPAVPVPARDREGPDGDEDETYVAENGLRSRRRMADAYRIMNQNDVQRQGGNQDVFLTVSDLHDTFGVSLFEVEMFLRRGL
ncbi:uncharacterized protein LTR77_003350 [Saxophila tyrrhenica]|uniref:WD40 repeat-like protein n=1 Tax=Saxophila tyrrhenica TaxID=1690608 RepID=A0AAV9PHQ0_9PEZI|nr:hypothetical protein LTR77_003350 [Saxophila tyrrhenica]